MFDDVLMRLRAPRPNIDAFGDKTTAKCQKYWGPGGVAHSAWSQDWLVDRCGTLWCNPTFQAYDIADILRKAGKDNADLVMVIPDWPEYEFYNVMWSRATTYHYYAPGSGLFESGGEDCEWGVWAVYMAAKRGAGDAERGTKMKTQQVYQKNSSAKRRFRRRQQRSLAEGREPPRGHESEEEHVE